MSNRDLIQIVVVTVLWALCYPLVTVAVVDAPPLLIGALRATVAGATLIAVAMWRRRPWPSMRSLGVVALAGLGLTSMGFAGMFLAGGKIGPGLATVLSNVQPLMAAVLGVFVLRESVWGRRGVALSLGFCGILVVSYPTLAGDGADSTPAGIGFVLLGAVGVAMGNVVLKRVAHAVDAIVASGWSLLFGAAPLWVLAFVMGEVTPHRLTANLIWSVAVLTWAGTALVSVLWLDLLQRNELVRLNIFTFLTPMFGLVIGIVFFDERLGTTEWVGIALVLAAVVVVSTFRVRSKQG